MINTLLTQITPDILTPLGVSISGFLVAVIKRLEIVE